MKDKFLVCNINLFTKEQSILLIRDNDYIIEGNIYIYKERIIKATKSGIIKSGMYKILSFYNFGEDYPNYTERYISRYSYYDSDTHEFLGKYLR